MKTLNKNLKQVKKTWFRTSSVLFPLFWLSLLTTAQGQEIAQAQALTPISQQAGDLNGVTGTRILPGEPLSFVAQTAAPTAADEEDIDLLEEVLVTAQRRRLSERDSSLTEFTVTKNDFESRGAKTLGEALKVVPNFFSVDLSGLASDKATFLRGLDSRRFVLLVDGRPTNRPQDGRAADVGSLPLANVERIEVITGGAALRYSADAVAGVINVVTAVPQGPRKIEASFSAGSFGFAQYKLTLTDSNGPDIDAPGYFAYNLGYERRSIINNYQYRYSDTGLTNNVAINTSGAQVQPGENFQIPVDSQFTLNGGYAFSDLYFGKAYYKPNKAQSLSIDFSQLNTRLGDQNAKLNNAGCIVIPAGYTDPSFGGGPDSTDTLNCEPIPRTPLTSRGDQIESKTAVNVVWDLKIDNDSSLNFRTSLSSSYVFYPSAALDTLSPGVLPSGYPYVSNRVIDTQLNYNLQHSPGGNLTAGFQFTTLRYNATPQIGVGPEGVRSEFGAVRNVDRETNRFAFYVVESLKSKDDRIAFDLGARLTTDLDYGTFFTPGAAFRYSFGAPLGQDQPYAIRANFTQSFKAPGLSQLYGSSQLFTTPFPAANVANPFLKAERGTTYDLGVDIKVSPDIFFRATYFNTLLVNAIQENVPVDPNQRVILNTPDFGPLPSTLGGAYFEATGRNLPPFFSTVNAQALVSQGFEFTVDWKINSRLQLVLSHGIVDTRPIGGGLDQFQISGINAIFSDFIANGAGFGIGEGSSFPTRLNGGFYYGYQTVDVPFSTTSLVLRYGNPGEFQAVLSGQFVGLRPRSLAGSFFRPAYAKIDFTFSLPLTSYATLTGGVFNITNERYVLSDTATNIGGGIVSPPTNFRFGMDFTF